MEWLFPPLPALELTKIPIVRIGPEKGVIHIATGAVGNAIWDMYARSRSKPLWKLVVDMTPVRSCGLVACSWNLGLTLSYRRSWSVPQPSDTLLMLSPPMKL